MNRRLRDVHLGQGFFSTQHNSVKPATGFNNVRHKKKVQIKNTFDVPFATDFLVDSICAGSLLIVKGPCASAYNLSWLVTSRLFLGLFTQPNVHLDLESRALQILIWQ